MTTKNHTTQTPKVIKREFEGTVVSAKQDKTMVCDFSCKENCIIREI